MNAPGSPAHRATPASSRQGPTRPGITRPASKAPQVTARRLPARPRTAPLQAAFEPARSTTRPIPAAEAPARPGATLPEGCDEPPASKRAGMAPSQSRGRPSLPREASACERCRGRCGPRPPAPPPVDTSGPSRRCPDRPGDANHPAATRAFVPSRNPPTRGRSGWNATGSCDGYWAWTGLQRGRGPGFCASAASGAHGRLREWGGGGGGVSWRLRAR